MKSVCGTLYIQNQTKIVLARCKVRRVSFLLILWRSNRYSEETTTEVEDPHIHRRTGLKTSRENLLCANFVHTYMPKTCSFGFSPVKKPGFSTIRLLHKFCVISTLPLFHFDGKNYQKSPKIS